MSSSHISVFLRKLVIKRAKGRCEYCRLSQQGQEATFHIDHILSERLGGKTVPENLALACVSCSLRKGARREVVDPKSGKLILLFNPRLDSWDAHFEWNGVRIEGKTPVGRVTVETLKLNRKLVLAIRNEEFIKGRLP